MWLLSVGMAKEIDLTNYQLTWIWLGVFAILAVMQWNNKLPAPAAFHEFCDVLNGRGGNILILAVLSMYFFIQSMRLFYNLMDLSKGGFIQQDNAFALMGLQFATASAFGGAFGALLKTMTGDSSRSRTADRGKGSNVPEPVTGDTSESAPDNSGEQKA